MEWNISKNSKKCLSCDVDFIDKDEFFSALLDNGNTFDRKDFCPNCWNECDKRTVFSFWKSRVPDNNEQPKPVINTNAILDLFFKLESEVNEKSKINLRYVLALFLIRKKLLKLKSSEMQGENEQLILYYPKESRDIELLNPKLTSDEINQITNEIKTLFDSPNLTLN